MIRTYTERGQLATLAVGSTTIDTRTYDDGGSMTASRYNNGGRLERACAGVPTSVGDRGKDTAISKIL